MTDPGKLKGCDLDLRGVSARELAGLLETVRAIYSQTALESLRQTVVQEVGKLLGPDAVTCPVTCPLHPACHRLELYPLAAGAVGSPVSLCRGRRDYSAHDRLVLKLLRPHVFQAYLNALTLETAGLQAARQTGAPGRPRQGTISVCPAGRIERLSPICASLLERFFSWKTPRRSASLPPVLHRWIRASTKISPSTLPSPLVVDAAHGRLTVWRVPSGKAGVTLVLAEEPPSGARGAAPFRLTGREVNVLHWIREGKTNPEIATILGISIRTVHKHVEHLLAKCSVERRTGLMLDLLPPPATPPAARV